MIINLKQSNMSNSDVYYDLYKQQMQERMRLAELFGSAIGRLKVASAMSEDKFLKEYLDEGIKDLEERFYENKPQSHES